MHDLIDVAPITSDLKPLPSLDSLKFLAFQDKAIFAFTHEVNDIKYHNFVKKLTCHKRWKVSDGKKLMIIIMNSYKILCHVQEKT